MRFVLSLRVTLMSLGRRTVSHGYDKKLHPIPSPEGSMTLVASLAVSVAAELTGALDLATADVPLNRKYKTDLANGIGAGNADRIWHDQRQIAASGTDDIDLAGVLTDALGAGVTMARVKAIIIKAADGNTNNLVVGNATSNGFISWVGASTHTITVRPGTTFALIAGSGDTTCYTVTAGTADLFRVANGSGTPVTYDIVIIGCSS
jgi:hypothetical protein